MKTLIKHIAPFLLGALAFAAPAADYIRFADMTGSSLVPTTNKIEALNAQIEEVAGEVIAGLPDPFVSLIIDLQFLHLIVLSLGQSFLRLHYGR